MPICIEKFVKILEGGMQILVITVESKNFGIEVKKRLLDIGMKQAELAEKMGVSESYISEILSGKRDAFDARKKILSVINAEAVIIYECEENKKLPEGS